MVTNHNGNEDRSTRELIAELARRQADTQTQLDSFLETANQVLARSAVLDDVVLELRDSTEQHQRNFEEHQRNFEEHQRNFEEHQRNFEEHQRNTERNFEQHQRNFEEHQRTTNAALERLEAILLQLIPKGEN